MPTSPKADTKEKAAVARCSGCNHPASFHQRGPCMVMSCKCKKWNSVKAVKKS